MLKDNKKRRFSPTLMIVISCLFLGIGLFTSGQRERQVILKDSNFILSQNSFLVPLSNPANPDLEVVSKFKTVITAYSSTPEQTDETPFITASNKTVQDGIVANNYFPFGTKIRIPELYGDKVFVVEDRMHWRKSNYQFDVWHSNYEEAVDFGAEITYVEVLGR